MRTILFAVLLLAVSCTVSWGDELAKHLQDISVTVNAGNAEGSGVIVTRDMKVREGSEETKRVNFVWTAGHVVDGLRSVRTVIDSKGTERKTVEFKEARIVKELVEDGRKVGELKMDATVIKYSDADHGQDLALLMLRKVDFVTDSAKFYPTDDPLPLGTSLFHVGSLLGQAGANSMTSGIVSQVGRVLDLGGGAGVVMDQTTVTAFPGCLTADTMIDLGRGEYSRIVDVNGGADVITYDDRIPTASGVWANAIEAGGRVLSFQTITGMRDKLTGECNLRPVVAGKVVRSWATGIKPVLRISTRNRSVKATANHPFVKVVSVPSLDNRVYHVAQWCPAGELSVGDVVAVMSRNTPYRKSQGLHLRGVFGDKTNHLPAMRMLGFYVGDGFSRIRPQEGGEVCLYTFDDRDTERYSSILRDNFGLNPKLASTSSGEYIRVSSVAFARMLSDLGVTGNAHTKRIPEWVFQCPDELQVEFLEGLIDADGHRVVGESYWTLELANKDLIQDSWELATNLGMGTSNIRERERTAQISGRDVSTRTWTIEIYPDPTKKSAQIDGTKDLLPEGLKFERISSVEPAGEEMTYDMEVASYHNFFANGFLVHNSSGGGVFVADGEHKGEYVGMLVRGAGEQFNLIVPVRRIRKFCQESELLWAIDESAPAPTIEDLKSIRVEDSAAEAHLPKPAEAPKEMEFLIKRGSDDGSEGSRATISVLRSR